MNSYGIEAHKGTAALDRLLRVTHAAAQGDALLPVQDLLPSDMTLNGTENKSQDYNRQRTVFLTELLTNGGYLISDVR